jgi:tripartite-type tricarboxylate transporter receptor subunit TctC
VDARYGEAQVGKDRHGGAGVARLVNAMSRRRLLAAAGICLTRGVFGARADSYPNKPVHLVVPFAPGGTSDLIARIVCEQVQSALGQPMIIENRAGGGGSVGAAETARATPDGYSLGLATVSTTASNPAINPKLPYDPIADFTPIINIAATPNVIAVHPSFPARSYPEFIAELSRRPGAYSYGSSGTGGIAHLQMELFKSLTHTFITHIPYRGSGPALNDTVAGQVPMIFDNLPSILPFIKDRRLIAIVVAAPHRLPQLASIPTFAEVGLGPVNRMAYYGIYGPRGLPGEVVDRVNAAVRKTLDDPAVRKRVEDSGALVVAGTPREFAAQIAAEFEVYRKVVHQQRLTLE